VDGRHQSEVHEWTMLVGRSDRQCAAGADNAGTCLIASSRLVLASA